MKQRSPTGLTLILGGARSGKSTYAETLAADMAQHVLYIATAEAKDADMAERIAIHRSTRPATWRTLEAPKDLASALATALATDALATDALATIEDPPEVILLDCLTLLVTTIVLAMENQAQQAQQVQQAQINIEMTVQAEIEALLAVGRTFAVPLIVVSNEVGLGVVPPYPLGRLYRDILGRANQALAAKADRVLFMVAGLPMTVKDNG